MSDTRLGNNSLLLKFLLEEKRNAIEVVDVYTRPDADAICAFRIGMYIGELEITINELEKKYE